MSDMSDTEQESKRNVPKEMKILFNFTRVKNTCDRFKTNKDVRISISAAVYLAAVLHKIEEEKFKQLLWQFEDADSRPSSRRLTSEMLLNLVCDNAEFKYLKPYLGMIAKETPNYKEELVGVKRNIDEAAILEGKEAPDFKKMRSIIQKNDATRRIQPKKERFVK
jgi:hypothetical protein